MTHWNSASHAATRTRIKMCGFTREQDVDAAVQAGADAIGFVLYEESARAVSAQRAAQLAQRLPPFITPVLLFVNHSASQIHDALVLLPHATVQFHGDETPQFCHSWHLQTQTPFVRAARISLEPQAVMLDLLEYAQLYSSAQALLLDAHVEGYGGGGKVFNWSLLPPNVNAHLVLSGGLTAANVGNGIAQVQPRCKSLAVDISSGIEVSGPQGGTERGIKDPQKIHQFVAAVKAADAQLAGNLHS